MSIGRAIAEYISHQRHEKHLPDDPPPEDLPPLIFPDQDLAIYPDVVNFVDQEHERSAQFMDTKREGMAYGIVSDILAPRYGGEARVASVVFDFANRANIEEMRDIQPSPAQEFRFERAFSAILNILSVLPEDMRGNDPDKPLTAYDGKLKYKISSLQVTDSARILISAGFMRGYIIVDVGYTLGVNDG